MIAAPAVERVPRETESAAIQRRPKAAITGASGGLGSAFARQLAAKGYYLLLSDINAERLEILADELRQEYAIEVECFAGNLCDSQDLRDLMDHWGQDHQLEVLVNCAGFGGTNHYAVADIDRLQAMMQVHVTASVMLTRAVLPGMLDRNCGYIINVASIMAYVRKGPVSYGATKRFLIDFSERLQAEIKHSAVKIQALCPGVMRTGFFEDPYFKQMSFADTIPKRAWLDVNDVVTESLQALRGRRVVCIPGRFYQWMCAIANHPWNLWRIGQGKRRARQPLPPGHFGLIERKQPPTDADFQQDLATMKSVVVTGVSTGIGRAAAIMLVRQGFRVFGTVRKLDDAAELQAECGEAFTPVLCNVRDDASVREAAETVAGYLGGETLWGLVNNAGVALVGPLMHVPLQDVRNQMDVNITGMIAVTQAFLPLLGANLKRAAGTVPGRIINVSSISGIIALPMFGAYAASKYAVEALSRSLRTEIAWYGIPVILIEPGPIESPIWSKMIDPELYKNTDYEHMAHVTEAELLRTNEGQALPVVKTSEAIYHALTDKKPRERYVVNKYPLGRSILTRWIPQRWIDGALRKKFLKMGLPGSSPK
jgi:short-subunit dehydrogenase